MQGRFAKRLLARSPNQVAASASALFELESEFRKLCAPDKFPDEGFADRSTVPGKTRLNDIPKIRDCDFSHLTPALIDDAPQINNWLAQFSSSDQSIAKSLLSRLKFVSRDAFSRWILNAVRSANTGGQAALYSIRKLENQIFWDSDGNTHTRPGSSLGSEDLVYSIISNLARTKDSYLDHPSISKLKIKKISEIYLIDDSIGSGDRTIEFINAFLSHPTIMSWWSYGIIRINLFAFARSKGSENKILNNILSKRACRRDKKIKNIEKIKFNSRICYQEDYYEGRWGNEFQKIIELCQKNTKIDQKLRLGYGDVMSNIVFYHSVPNNLPGILWREKKHWKALMPNRVIPDWLQEMLGPNGRASNSVGSNEILDLLRLIKSGITSRNGLARRMGVERKHIEELINATRHDGFLEESDRLSDSGFAALGMDRAHELPRWDRSMYIPTSWCAGR